ncbi:hypothetical protein DEA8626_01443 [Defluviimonas aquaemixtae]|uniref:DUF4440 domain-containing protein n=1 Tax=Albidovulum aquaemixtae TaxID=1542388 RepID=A0A2R8B5P2_9RHOB|nr:nuclear transport factor 2 family protein [Defluviimonas aquaemixtae]SPH17915.1 hypothetical protein DEA8626_01443 [Defluviimonas aquaemixtae]
MFKLFCAATACALINFSAGVALAQTDIQDINSVFAAFGLNPEDYNEDERQVLRLEMVECLMLKDGNSEEWGKSIDPEGVSVDSSGYHSIADVRETVLSDGFQLMSATLEDPRFKAVGDDVLILTYLTASEVLLMGETHSGDTINTTVYANNGDGWLAVYHHSGGYDRQ